MTPRVLARLLLIYGTDQFDLCEDAVQEALLEAHRSWKTDPPQDPMGWLVTSARRRYIDRVRAERRRRDREAKVALLDEPLTRDTSDVDDSLLILQLCCHPDLPRSGQISLTLRAVCGLSTAQIAGVYLLPEATVAQRITRAKKRLHDLGRTFPSHQTPERLSTILNVLYVMFTQAHHTTSGSPVHDTDLAGEAIHLARQVHDGFPENTEGAGLLALMLLTEARQPARTTPTGELITLDEQDRSLWNTDLAAEGLLLLDLTVPGATPGPYLLQACIAALHAQATDVESTDWEEILALYRLLEIETGSQNPSIHLNRIVAEAMVHGPATALDLLDQLQHQHPTLPRIHAVRADLLIRNGDPASAAAEYREAIDTTHNLAEQRQLRKKLRNLTAS